MRYTFRTGNLNPLGFWKWSIEKGKMWYIKSKQEKERYKVPVFIFHGIESLLIIFVLTYFFPVFWYVLIGVMFHMIFDLINMYNRGENLFGKVSIIYVLIHNRSKMKTHG